MSATTSSPRRGAHLDGLELGAWRGFLRTHAALSRALDADLLATHGLSLSSYEVLLFLADSPEGHMRMSELADSVLLSRSGLTRLVDRLERERLVERVSCPGDARGMNAAITSPGRERFAKARKTHLDGVRRHYLDHLTDQEKELLTGIWERMLPASVPA